MEPLKPGSTNFFHLAGKVDPRTEILNSGVITSGDVFWVKDPSDDDYISFKDAVGTQNLADTIQGGIDLCANDQNDFVLVCPKKDGTPWDITAAVDINKDRIHVLGLGSGPHPYSYANTIRGYATGSSDDELVHITGHGVEFAGFRILATAGTDAAGSTDNGILYFGTAASGTAHEAYIHDVLVEADYTDDAAPVNMIASVAGVNNAYFDNVRVTYAAAGTMIPVALPHSGKRWEFHNSKFVKDAEDAGDWYVTPGTGATDYALFKNCEFVNVNASTTPASAVVGSATVDNPVLLSYCTSVNIDDFGTDPTVFVAPVASGTAAVTYNPGIASGTDAIAAA